MFGGSSSPFILTSWARGSGGGGGAGFGFATGAIVANSTGNTPANGFTLNDGAGTSMTVVPSEIDFFNPSDSEITLALNGSNPYVSVNDSSGNSAVLGFGGTNGASLVLDSAGGNSIVADATVPSISLNGPTWTSGTGVPSGTPAIGSFYSRTDGGVGSSFYVYNGSAWLAIA